MPVANEMSKEEFDKLQKKMKREKWEIMFARQLEEIGFEEAPKDSRVMPGQYVREYRFCPSRRWRVDFLIIYKKAEWGNEYSILVEIEGGTYARGRHTRGSGYAKDCEKYNHAALAGWQVYRFTGEMIKDGSAIRWLQEHVF